MTESNANDHLLIEIRNEGGYVSENQQTSSGFSIRDEILASQIREKFFLINQIREKLSLLSPLPDVPCCIFRIPSVLRSQAENKDFSSPDLVSVGPFHHGEEKLQTMEEIKLMYLHSLLVRKPTPRTTLENFVREIRSMVGECGDCYDGKIDSSSDEFLKMMVVDSCFIIELFRKFSGEVPEEKNDPVFCRPWMRTALINDLLLLENQLPWRVLSCLSDLTRETGKYHLHDLILMFFKGYTFGLSPQVNGELENKHVLDFLRNCLVSSWETKEYEVSSWNSIPSVENLVDAGFRFRRSYGEAGMLEITYRDGVLVIPPIRVQKNGESFLRNLIAYEQCATITGSVTSYVVLLRDLIRTEKDVLILRSSGILQGISTGEEIVAFIDRLCADVEICSSPYGKRLEGVINQTNFQKCLSQLNIIFKDPLVLINFGVGVFVVTVLTVIQTMCSLISLLPNWNR